MPASDETSSNAPYCGHCGYVLIGATESSKCPECGKPLVEVLMRPAFDRKRSVRYQSEARFMGFPVVSIACGKYGPERFGHAKGFIAIGDIATGVLAIGLFARGVVSMGVVSIGAISFGSMAIGVCAFGGLAIGALALGGIAIGGIALGGVAVGVLRAVGGATFKLPM